NSVIPNSSIKTVCVEKPTVKQDVDTTCHDKKPTSAQKHNTSNLRSHQPCTKSEITTSSSTPDDCAQRLLCNKTDSHAEKSSLEEEHSNTLKTVKTVESPIRALTFPSRWIPQISSTNDSKNNAHHNAAPKVSIVNLRKANADLKPTT